MKDFFITFLILCSGLISAQNDFRSGYLIKNNNDTIYGFINYKSNYQNSLECEFKKNKDSQYEIYTPSDIKEYHIDDSKYYVSKEITMNNTKERVFLEYLVDGILDLYFLKIPDNEYYYIEKDTTLYELSNNIIKYEVKERPADAPDYLNTNDVFEKSSNKYIGILNFVMKDSPKTTSRLKYTSFNYKSLIKITKDYHNEVCDDYECIVFSKSGKENFSIEPSIGCFLGVLGFKTSKDFGTDIKPAFGINFRFSPEQFFYRWNIIVGLNYSYNRFDHEFLNSVYAKDFPETYRLYLNNSVIRIPIKIEYTFPSKKIKPFLTAAYNNVLIINPDYKVLQVEGLEYSFEQKSPFRKYQFGFLGGAGIKYQVNQNSYFIFEADYEYRMPSKNARYILDYIHFNSLLMNIGYGFIISKNS